MKHGISLPKATEAGVALDRSTRRNLACVPQCASNWSRLVARWLLFPAAVLLVMETDAFAYSDPGSGALLWQALLAGCFGALFYLRRFMSWFRFGRKRSKDTTSLLKDD